MKLNVRLLCAPRSTLNETPSPKVLQVGELEVKFNLTVSTFADEVQLVTELVIVAGPNSSTVPGVMLRVMGLQVVLAWAGDATASARSTAANAGRSVLPVNIWVLSWGGFTWAKCSYTLPVLFAYSSPPAHPI